MTKRMANISTLLKASPSFYILPISKRNTGKRTMLFSSALAAREVAYILRGDWDGLNAVTLYQSDAVAVQNALALLKLELGKEEVECCHTGECCTLLLSLIAPTFENRSGKSMLVVELLLQAP